MASRRARSAGERVWLRSTWALVASISLSYWTPDGQAGTQAMQPRQRSKCSTIESDSGSPLSPWLISWIRPRGESISSPHRAYVGQVGRQKPQCTQSETSSGSGGRCASKAGMPSGTGSPLVDAGTSPVPWVASTDTSDPSHEPAGREQRVRVEPLLDPAHQVEPGHRSPTVHF